MLGRGGIADRMQLCMEKASRAGEGSLIFTYYLHGQPLGNSDWSLDSGTLLSIAAQCTVLHNTNRETEIQTTLPL